MRTDAIPGPLAGRQVLVAASGSIAAVKTPLLVSALVKAGAEVRCLVTPSAERLGQCGRLGKLESTSPVIAMATNGIRPEAGRCILTWLNGRSWLLSLP